jgi:hypothetical protein
MIKNQEALEVRAQNLGSLNGVELVLVTLHPAVNPTQALLDVHFYNTNQLNDIFDDFDNGVRTAHDLFPLSGGLRKPAGALSDQVKVIDIAKVAGQNQVLRLTVEPIGDYSTYTLSVNYQDIDPLLSEIEFKFRPGCFNLCQPDWDAPLAPKTNPPIDYLAKDFESFRHTMITWMGQQVPNWEPTSEADLDQVLLELFSVAADELSDYQDRVVNEAYLGTARKRVSLARHARLMDYHLHQGNQASTKLALQVKAPDILTDGFMAWTDGEFNQSSTIVFAHHRTTSPLFELAPALQTDLDAAAVSAALRQAFDDRQWTLSSSVTITITSLGAAWLIDDSGEHRTFCVRKESGRIYVYAPNLDQRLNQMSLYTWSEAVPTLKAGSTQADLKVDPTGDEDMAKYVETLIRDEAVTTLLVQEELNPLTGQEPGRDPTKRQLLRLLPGDENRELRATAMQDPVTSEWYVRVRWKDEDKLKYNYCFTVECGAETVNDVSAFYGNLVNVHHGRLEQVIFREPGVTLAISGEKHYEKLTAQGRDITICRLPSGPLAYTNTAPGGEIPPRSTLKVEVEVGGDRDPWDEAIDLVHSDDSDERGDHFVVETDEEGFSLIRFGDGTNGRKLPPEAVVHCQYQIGDGLEGNIGAEMLTRFTGMSSPSANITQIWNPFDADNGRAPEPVAELIRRVPEAYRYRQLRAVTLRDYVNRAEELQQVSKASARYMWTGSWRTVRVTVDPVGATSVSEALEEKVMRHLEAVRLIGEDLEIRPPEFVPLEIEVSLCIHSDYWVEHIREILEQEFSDGYTPDGRLGFFHPDRWTFGQALHESQLVGPIQAVRGVDHVLEVKMKRWNAATSGKAGVITVRSNEIILVKNDPDHKEHGTILFDIQGGRR